MNQKSLLVELFVEELPPKALKGLGQAFAQGLSSALQGQGLLASEAVVTPYATPRRLAVHLTHVASRAQDRSVRHKLMPVSVGLGADGQPTAALLKKLAALGADASALPGLQREMDGKAEALFLQATVPGATLAEGLQQALDEALARLPIPKVMTYQLEAGEGADFQPGWTSVKFVRPAHGLVALHGEDIVSVSVLGLRAGRHTQGHRFEARVHPIAIAHADRYEAQLADEGAVIAGFERRRADIAAQLQAAAGRVGGGAQPIVDEALLDEVTALVERPRVLVGQFEQAFLEVPQECLILTMKANQKYFPLLDAAGKLTHRFLIVSNISPADPSQVIQGNERVVRPRLADAKFFFDQDRKKTLASRLPGLDKVVYHGKLGSQGERTQRVRAIAASIAIQMGLPPAQLSLVDVAAQLAKTDLLTDMVGEFPELQGVMGSYYARAEGLDDAVAQAIEDHYKPRFAGDTLPRQVVGLAVALADKLETLVGLFGIGQRPSGDKDPYALRRHALGVIRMLIERELPLEPRRLIQDAAQAFAPGVLQDAGADLEAFMTERLRGYLRELDYGAAEVEAVVCAPGLTHWADVPRRLAAVRAFASLPESASLSAANKRVSNILKKADGPVHPQLSQALLKEPAEVALAAALAGVQPRADAAFGQGDYTASLKALAALKEPVDRFFDDVMVNAEDAALRANRLGLLAVLQAAMNRVADLSKLAA